MKTEYLKIIPLRTQLYGKRKKYIFLKEQGNKFTPLGTFSRTLQQNENIFLNFTALPYLSCLFLLF